MEIKLCMFVFRRMSEKSCALRILPKRIFVFSEYPAADATGLVYEGEASNKYQCVDIESIFR